MASLSTVGLLEVEPDIGGFLTPEERAAVAEEVSAPVATVLKGDFTLRGEPESFGAVVLEGMLFQRLRVGQRVAPRLLGPGDILAVGGTLRSALLREAECRAAAPSKLALLDNGVLSAARRWPRLMAGLHARIGEQSERLAVQLVIRQLPRVEERLLALLWLLAESWGRVTPVGTAVPVSLTHDALGELIGARRSTATLALSELTERGAIVRQNGSWLLLESPPEPIGEMPSVEGPRLFSDAPSSWARTDTHAELDAIWRVELRETFVSVQEQHQRDVEDYRERLSGFASAREQSWLTRREIARQALKRRAARG